jgi:hypothetical protein
MLKIEDPLDFIRERRKYYSSYPPDNELRRASDEVLITLGDAGVEETDVIAYRFYMLEHPEASDAQAEEASELTPTTIWKVATSFEKGREMALDEVEAMALHKLSLLAYNIGLVGVVRAVTEGPRFRHQSLESLRREALRSLRTSATAIPPLARTTLTSLIDKRNLQRLRESTTA